MPRPMMQLSLSAGPRWARRAPRRRWSLCPVSGWLRLAFGLSGALSLSCAGWGGATGTAPNADASDARLVLQQELGEAAPPAGPCPERSELGVLENPRASVQRTALGLAYCLLAEGPEGSSVPLATDSVRVHYSGWTPEGDLFDSSIERGEPAEFQLNGVIRGWTEGLRLMTPGDKARLWIPDHLAYGRREPGEPAGSPPKGTLIFEIELLEVVRGPEPTPPPSAGSSSDS